MDGRIIALNLPKWGLIMTEGTLSEWRVEVGARLEVGTVIADIESEKIVNELVAHEAGVLRRRLVPAGGTCNVGTLIGVLSEGEVPEAEIERFVAQSGATGVNGGGDTAVSGRRSTRREPSHGAPIDAKPSGGRKRRGIHTGRAARFGSLEVRAGDATRERAGRAVGC